VGPDGAHRHSDAYRQVPHTHTPTTPSISCCPLVTCPAASYLPRHAESRSSDAPHLAPSLAGRVRRRLPVRRPGCSGVGAEKEGNLRQASCGRATPYGPVGQAAGRERTPGPRRRGHPVAQHPGDGVAGAPLRPALPAAVAVTRRGARGEGLHGPAPGLTGGRRACGVPHARQGVGRARRDAGRPSPGTAPNPGASCATWSTASTTGSRRTSVSSPG